MFDKKYVQELDILQYKTEYNNIFGSIIGLGTFFGKYDHTSIFVGNLLERIANKYLKTRDTKLFRILKYADNLFGDCSDDTIINTLNSFKKELKYCICESHISTGVIIKILNPKWYNLIDMYRLKKDHDVIYLHTHKKEMEEWLINKVGSRYALGDFPSVWIRYAGSFFNKKFGAKDPIFNDSKSYYCTELVTSLYKEVLDISLTDLNKNSTPPSAINNKSNIVRLVK